MTLLHNVMYKHYSCQIPAPKRRHAKPYLIYYQLKHLEIKHVCWWYNALIILADLMWILPKYWAYMLWMSRVGRDFSAKTFLSRIWWFIETERSLWEHVNFDELFIMKKNWEKKSILPKCPILTTSDCNILIFSTELLFVSIF